ncbi:polysaccharide biosynthesis tyrosine autokinase [Luteococcus sp. Sow4_B9]|uniref:polysaccharide biosynthesis tyrosine autokinase n=1 Tax=Luteococcus sp. Sow4_B9 TaxID=3438792 RepID=UPI003F98C90F
MDLRSYVAIIRKYLPFILICGLIGLLAGFASYKTTPKQYAADVQFYVGTPVPDGGSAQAGGQFATGRMTSYVELLGSQELGDRVVKATGVQLTSDQVAKRIKAENTVDSVLVTAVVTDTDPTRAFTIAKGIAKVFGPMVDQLDNSGRKVPIVQISTVSAPQLHAAPVAPKPRMSLLLGLGAGLALALAIALLRELLDNSVRSADAARDLAGAPVIGEIPDDSSARVAPLLRGVDNDSARAEAHRKLRTSLAFLGATDRTQVVLFTAPEDGDGASTVAANTAISFAETGERVCFVEADLRHPSAREAFDTGLGGKGLSNVLAGEATLDSVITHWRGEPSIDLVTAGELPPNPAALLGAERFASTIEELRGRYDRVILDSPALLPFADAAVVAGISDGVVLVMRDGSTTAGELESARSALDAVRARVLGVVMNRTGAGSVLGKVFGKSN